MSNAAAFFDLDRTLISRPTPLALATTFRRHGLIRNRDLIRVGLWWALFLLPGIDGTRRAAVDGMSLRKDLPVATLQEIMGEAMEDALRPLLYAEPIDLVQHHREQGDAVFIVSASLQEIVAYVADDLGFDGGVGSTCEIATEYSPDGRSRPATASTRRKRYGHWQRNGTSTFPCRPRIRTPTRMSPSWRRSVSQLRSTRTRSFDGSPPHADGASSISNGYKAAAYSLATEKSRRRQDPPERLTLAPLANSSMRGMAAERSWRRCV